MDSIRSEIKIFNSINLVECFRDKICKNANEINKKKKRRKRM